MKYKAIMICTPQMWYNCIMILYHSIWYTPKNLVCYYITIVFSACISSTHTIKHNFNVNVQHTWAHGHMGMEVKSNH